jgi:ergothioneine biosynthesis protein EgtB
MSQDLLADYLRVRRDTEALCAPLEVEDYVVQPIDDVSPPKWHLGHTTWFFETFLLEPYEPGHPRARPDYAAVFNSYYQSVGNPYPRTRRGTLSRPTVNEIYAYRESVDERMQRLIARAPGEAGFEPALLLGLHHEQQHQELLAADIKYILAHNRIAAPKSGGGCAGPSPERKATAPPPIDLAGGVFRMGHSGEGFAFDNEGPAHDVLVGPFRLARTAATNADYAAFIEAGGYRDFRPWLSDGWDRLRAEGWQAPLHWDERGDPEDPVCHLSYYEADAFARWAGGRLPTEAEWEFAANALGRGPSAGTVWEWTSSAYGAYPGFRPAAGAFGEYNGKFMSGQFVLRGGSRATPEGHLRPTYRNFFQPEKRWQFTGVRLAWDK